MPAKAKRRPLLHPLLLLINGVALVPALLALAAPWVPPESSVPLGWTVALAALAMPAWVLVPLLGLALWWRRGWWAFVANALVLLALLPAALPALRLNGPIEAEGGFTVLTLNVKALDYSAEHLPELEALLARERPDLVVLQEYFTGYATGRDAFVARLRRAGGYGHSHVELLMPSNFGLAVFSRWPLQGARRVPPSRRSASNGILAIDVRHPDGPLRLYNVHLQSYKLSAAQRTLLDSLPTGGVEAQAVRSTLGRLRRSWRVQQAQVRALRRDLPRDLARTDTAVVIAGDLNNPPHGWVAHTLGQGLTDSFAERGWGLGHTYGSGLARFRIDYVWASPRLEVLEHRLVTPALSDHAGVLARLRFVGPSASAER